jgi:hypothetical protein
MERKRKEELEEERRKKEMEENEVERNETKSLSFHIVSVSDNSGLKSSIF